MVAGSDFGDLVINLRADSSGFAADLNKSKRTLGGFVKSATASLANIGLAANTLRSAFGALIGPMQEAQEAALAERKLAQVFKSTANAAGVAKDAVMEFAKERQKLTSFDADDTVNAAGTLGSFTNVKGDVFFSALKSAQDLSAFMGTDLESSIMLVGKALNDPIKGITALTRAGVSFSQGQKDQIKTLVEAGRMADAQAMILKELQTEFGGQAEALVDPIKQAEHAWGDFMETVGGIANEKLLPLMPKLIEGFERLSEVATKAFETVSPILEKVVDFNDALGEISSKGSGLVPSNLFEALAPGLSTLTGANEDTSRNEFNPLLSFMNPRKLLSEKPQTATAFVPEAAPTAAALPAAPANVGKISEGIVGKLDNLLTGGAKSRLRGTLFDMEKKEAGIKNQAESFMAGLIRDGITAVQSGVMSLGSPQAAFEGNKVGSLEQGSQEAFEVLRANVGAGGKDKVQEKQLSELQKLNKNTEKILANSKLNSRQKSELILGMDL